MYRNTYVEVNVDHIKNNIEEIKKEYPEYTYYIGVVKGNGYGHGSYVINAMIKKGINYLAVSSLDEALVVRTYNTEIPVLCLEPISLPYIHKAIENNITLTVSSLEYAKKLCEEVQNGTIKIHMKINTGMNRLGFKSKEEVKEAYTYLSSHFILEGIYSHFITTGISDSFWDRQVHTFKEVTSLLDLTKIPMVHMGRSLTLINHPKIDFCNGIRLGIIMYGLDQTPREDTSFKGNLKNFKANMRIKKYHISETTRSCKANLQTAFSLYTEVMEIQHIKKGDHVGYGLGYTAPRDMTVAVAPAGYADGFLRSNAGRMVYIGKQKYQIIGSVNMGMIQIKVDDSIKVGDQVELIGNHISIRYVASYLHTTPYECMCIIGASVPRIYRENNEIIYIEEWKV